MTVAASFALLRSVLRGVVVSGHVKLACSWLLLRGVWHCCKGCLSHERLINFGRVRSRRSLWRRHGHPSSPTLALDHPLRIFNSATRSSKLRVPLTSFVGP